MNNEDALPALDKPRVIYSLLRLLHPSGRHAEALHERVMQMRAEGLVKFDIQTGKWNRA
jgi:hypothetical protein